MNIIALELVKIAKELVSNKNVIYSVSESKGIPLFVLRGAGTRELKPWLKEHQFIWDGVIFGWKTWLLGKQEQKSLLQDLAQKGYNVSPGKNVEPKHVISLD